jgi:hypothetical protein
LAEQGKSINSPPQASPRKLPDSAHRELREGETYRPYVSPAEHPDEFTLKALVFGVLFGILFGAANAYLGLRAGLTISTSIPVAVMTVAVFHALRRMGGSATILEANLSQTVGSASSSVASGVIFTLPALFLWGLSPSLLQMTSLAMAGGMLGVLFMIPLRIAAANRESPVRWSSEKQPNCPGKPLPTACTCEAQVMVRPNPPCARMVSQRNSSSESRPSSKLCRLVIGASMKRFFITAPCLNVNG